MVIIGTDSHKRTHTFVAVDEVGRKVGEKTLAATTEGHLEALAWAEQWQERSWAIEDCRHLTRRLESDLLKGGEAVVRVPTKLMAAERRGDRERGKSDPIDALAVARAALREPNLPVARLDGPSRELKLLVDHREDLVRERTRMQARLRWHLHELFPGLVIPSRSLRRQRVFAELEILLQPVDGTIARIARELLTSIADLTRRANELEREITALVREATPSLLALPGCGALSAAKVLGEAAGASRFKSKAAFARWNGTAPIPVWSGSTNFRLNRGGNRQVNTALHRIAVTQARGIGAGRAYLDARTSRGDSKKEALRMLRRRLSDEVFRRLLLDEEVTCSKTSANDIPLAA
jgi:transposase